MVDKTFFLKGVFACMSMHHICTISLKGQKRALDLLGVRLQMVVSCHVFAWYQRQGSQEEYSTLLTIKPSLQSYMTLFMTHTSIDLYFSLITINSNMYFKKHTNIFTYTSKNHFSSRYMLL